VSEVTAIKLVLKYGSLLCPAHLFTCVCWLRWQQQ